MKLQHPLARTLVAARTWPFLIDSAIAACALAIFFSIVSTGRYWLGKPVPVVEISHSIGALPLYASYSIVRMAIAYLLSLGFAIAYGYTAAYNPRIEPWMVAVPWIFCQEVDSRLELPAAGGAGYGVVGSGPPARNRDGGHSAQLHGAGMEPGFQFLFLAQDHSEGNERGVAHLSLLRMAALLGTRYARSRRSAWSWGNSIVSVAGGWFALMLCETFTAWARAAFGLPGAGAATSSRLPIQEMCRRYCPGSGLVILIVVATDQLVWRPLIAWSDKFKFEQVESADRVTSPVLELFRRSGVFSSLPNRIWRRVEEPIFRRLARSDECRVVRPVDQEPARLRATPALWALGVAIFCAVCWGALQAVYMLRTGESGLLICACCSKVRARRFCA